MPKLLNRTELAALAGVPIYTLKWVLTSRGILPAQIIGNIPVYSEEQLTVILAAVASLRRPVRKMIYA